MSIKKYVMVTFLATVISYTPCWSMIHIATPTVVRGETEPLLDFTNVNTADDATFELETTERKRRVDAQENKEATILNAEYAVGVNHKGRRSSGASNKYLDGVSEPRHELNRRHGTFTHDGKQVVILFRQLNMPGRAYDNLTMSHEIATGNETDFGLGVKSAHAIAFNSEGSVFALVQPYSIELWDAQKVLIQKIVTKVPSFCLASDSDGQHLTREIFYDFITFSQDGKKFFVITGTGKQLTLCTYVFGKSKDGQQRISWHLAAAQPINQVVAQKYCIAAILPNGNLLVTPNIQHGPIKSLAIIDPFADRVIHTVDTKEKIKTGVSSLSTGGDYIIDAGYQDNSFKIIEFKTGKIILSEKLSLEKEVCSVQLSPDYEQVLITYQDGTIILKKIKKIPRKPSILSVDLEQISEVPQRGKCIIM